MNGLRYTVDDFDVDISYDNIRHLFWCNPDQLQKLQQVIFHIQLRKPMKIEYGPKVKQTIYLQFHKQCFNVSESSITGDYSDADDESYQRKQLQRDKLQFNEFVHEFEKHISNHVPDMLLQLQVEFPATDKKYHFRGCTKNQMSTITLSNNAAALIGRFSHAPL
jgi:hypothetical protein